MARKRRFIVPGVPQHIIQRGHNREPCFYAEADYSRYLHNLQDAAEKNDTKIHAYVLMTNHIHLLATPGHEYSITHTIQDLGRKYVRYLNTTYKRTGALWEGRFKACLVDSEAYLLTCMRYIEMNPVRAGMVEHPGEYRWSSYACNATGKSNTIIEPHPLYIALADKKVERHKAYRELFSMHIDPEDIHAIRSALNQELVVGRDDFKDKIERMINRQTRAGKPGQPCIKEPKVTYYSG